MLWILSVAQEIMDCDHVSPISFPRGGNMVSDCLDWRGQAQGGGISDVSYTDYYDDIKELISWV